MPYNVIYMPDETIDLASRDMEVKMLDIKSAYEVLGLSESVSKEDIEKRYAILLKKYRSIDIDDKENSGITKDEINKVTTAYNLLMGYETLEQEDNIEKEPNLVFKKLGVDQKKFENFIHYYKFHILGGIVAVVALVSIIVSIVTNVDPDLNVAFIGSVFCQDTDVFKEKTVDAMPDLKAVGTDAATIFEGMDGQMEYAANMKLVVLFAGADVDVFLIDKEYFEKYAEQGAFKNLDELAQELKVEENGVKVYRKKTESDEQEHIYGIDLTENASLRESGVEGQKIIAAIRANSKHYDNAIGLIKYLLENR